jgi:hypothetical protein
MNASSASHHRVAQRDRYGLPLSTTPRAAAAYVRAVDGMLRLHPGPERHLHEALAADPEFALGHAALGLLHHQRGEPAAASSRLRRAVATAGRLTPRERGHVAALAAAVTGTASAAGTGASERPRHLLGAHLAAYPRDVLLLRQASAAVDAAGGPDLRLARRRLLAGVAAAYGADSWFLGDFAFEQAEAGRCRLARGMAGRALARDPRDANAAHAMAHALSADGAHGATAGFVREWLSGYPPAAPEYSHLSWHLAMSELRRGRRDRALAVYHERLDPAGAPASRLRDAAGFLWTLHLRPKRDGGRLATLWAPVRALATAALARRPDGADGADAVHAAMAFAATGDAAGAAGLRAQVAAQAAGGDDLAATLVRPLVRAVLAFGAGEYATTRTLLGPLVPHLERLGVSNGQGAVIVATLAAAHRRTAPHRARPVARLPREGVYTMLHAGTDRAGRADAR